MSSVRATSLRSSASPRAARPTSHGVSVAGMIAFIVAAVIAYLFGFTKEQLSADAQAAAEIAFSEVQKA